jgi:glycerate dehydrogenase
VKIVVLDGYTLNPGDVSWDELNRLGETVVYDRTAPEQLLERASGADVLFTNKTVLSAETFAQLPGLRFVGVLATGYNVVDVKAAAQHGVVVSNIPEYGTQAVAQFTIALLLELCSAVGRHSEEVKQGAWASSPDWCFTRSPLIELAGKKMGVIGQQMARIADALGMNIIVPERGKPLPDTFAQARKVQMKELFAQADVISLHCPLTPDTQGIINRGSLQLMKSSAFLLNTARGALIVDQDLADALNDGQIAGAGLDVLTVEPPRQGNPLIGARNCIITPHIAWAAKEARIRLMETAADNLKAFLAGKPQYVVSPAL